MKTNNWLLLIVIPFLWTACNNDDVTTTTEETTTEKTFAQKIAGNNPTEQFLDELFANW